MRSLNKLSVKIGQRVEIRNNQIFMIMGFRVATGVVKGVGYESASFVCDQTGCYEGADYNDGTWRIVG